MSGASRRSSAVTHGLLRRRRHDSGVAGVHKQKKFNCSSLCCVDVDTMSLTSDRSGEAHRAGAQRNNDQLLLTSSL